MKAHNYSDRAATRLLSYLLWVSGLAALARQILTRNGRFVLMFHGISTAKRPELSKDVQPHLCKNELRAILSWLQKRFDFITPEAFLNTHNPGILLTFDDGLANNHANALPILEEFEAPAVFFITTQHIKDQRNWLPSEKEKVARVWDHPSEVPDSIGRDFFDGMSPGQVITCANHTLITIGAHSLSHPFLTSCTKMQLEIEVAGSKKYLEELTGKPVDLFAYPTGDYNRQVAEAVQQAGCQAAFAMDTQRVGMPLFEIPRVGLYDAHPAYLSLKLSGLHRRPI